MVSGVPDGSRTTTEARVQAVLDLVEPWPCDCREALWDGEPILMSCQRCAVLAVVRPSTQTEEIF